MRTKYIGFHHKPSPTLDGWFLSSYSDFRFVFSNDASRELASSVLLPSFFVRTLDK